MAAGGQVTSNAHDATSRKKRRQQKKGLQAGQLIGTARREDLVNLWDAVVQVCSSDGEVSGSPS